MLSRALTIAIAGLTAAASAQLPGLDRLKGGLPGLDSIFKKGPAVTTSLPDAKFEAKDRDGQAPEPIGDLFSLERTGRGGFTLREGGWAAQLQSY